ncbi:PREDICTED: protocadherin gamma-A11-like, partial [Buceros rhinoceros silvestris]|uniref:protocadherin gamma-A11-like n=1 Tax=Buceros rhinoceros silvestris TaxID=175836 RepID=UPI000528EA0D
MNGHVKYSLKKKTDIVSEIFQLDSETGAITLVQSLDFEEGDSYELEVQAYDGAAFFDTAKVSFTVTDINDNTPEISVRSVLSAISEDAPLGTVVALLHVQDRDSGANGEVRCSLDGTLPFRLQSSQRGYYSVVTSRELDREAVEDGGMPALSSNVSVQLIIVDENDNAPQVLYPPPASGLAAGLGPVPGVRMAAGLGPVP